MTVLKMLLLKLWLIKYFLYLHVYIHVYALINIICKAVKIVNASCRGGTLNHQSHLYSLKQTKCSDLDLDLVLF